MDLSNFWWQAGASGPNHDLIGNALRFRGAQYLERTPATSSTSRSAATFSVWAKHDGTYDIDNILSAGVASYYDSIVYDGDTCSFALANGASSGLSGVLYPAARLRDPSAWRHHCYVWDTNNATVGDRMRLYINGVRVTDFASSPYTPAYPPQGFGFTHFFTATKHRMGAAAYSVTADRFFSGCLAEFHAVDGTAHLPTVFGEFNADGVWVPKKVSGVTYGTNGFHLAFDDVTNIGKDSSGNGNHFTATGFTTSGTGTDVMSDTPTTNWATIIANNPTYGYQSTTIADGNLQATFYPNAATGNPSAPALSSITVPASGKWYYEFTTAGSNNYAFGIAANNSGNLYNFTLSRAFWGWYHLYQAGYPSSGDGSSIYGGASGSASGGGFINVGDIIGVEIDIPSGSIVFKKNGSSYASITSCNFSSYTEFVIQWGTATNGISGSSIIANFGQRPFAHTPPAGFLPLNTADLPDVPIKNPSDHFTTILDTGPNILTAAQAKFPNGLWWIKDRANSNQNQLVDSVRGPTVAFTSPNDLRSMPYTAPAGNSVAWCWNAPDAFTGSGGTIASSGRRNVAAGFSIVDYTATGVTGTVAHGLSQAPEFIIVMNNDTAMDYQAGHALAGWTHRAFVNKDEAFAAELGAWNNTAPTATVFTAGTSRAATANRHIAYCWHSVPGMTHVGLYQGNNSDDGPFCYTGFRPAFVWIRSQQGGDSWMAFDSARDSYNPASKFLHSNLPNTESNAGTAGATIDILSNGFKVRKASNSVNNSVTHYYIAFAEAAFGGSNVSPATAR